jgi:hypothetical protein
VSESEEQGPDQAGYPVRDARTGKFQAGVSGNKSGRPKGAPSLASTKNVHLRDQIIEAARLAGTEIDPSSPDGVTVRGWRRGEPIVKTAGVTTRFRFEQQGSSAFFQPLSRSG